MVLTTGTFDGVHLGHQKIISRMCELASQIDGETMMLTFFPHPRMVLYPEDHGLELLSSQEEKIKLLEKTGIDHLLIIPFTGDVAQLSPTEYVRDILVNKLHVDTMIVGYDHRFGRNRAGDFKDLEHYSETYNFKLEQIQVKEIDNINISSTKIRNALKDGEVKKASQYLGYNYSLSGVVIKGESIGKTIGFPTANLKLDFDLKLKPQNGVYAVKCYTDDECVQGMLNIGVRPTINSKQELTIEVHLIDWSGDLYDKHITLELVEKVRNESKFESIEALAKQLQLDEEKVRESLA